MKRLLNVCALTVLTVSAARAQLVWFDGRQAVSYAVEGTVAPVVDVALQMFCSDMVQVTGQQAVNRRDGTIRICQLDANPRAAGQLRRQGVPVDSLLGRPDAFYVGARRPNIVIVGSNGRGCAYGLLELSRMAGVSPWVWWGDVVPERRERLIMADGFESLQAPSVAYRGIFINDEDWSLRQWAPLGPATYKSLFQLLLRLRANALWPAMHPGTPGFFTVEGNKQMADSCGIIIGTSHCEPLLRNNVAEWNQAERGDYNYITNRQQVQQYWAERLREVRGSEELFTIGMRGIHDGSMEGVKTPEEKLSGLQQVIDDQRQLIRRHYSKEVERVPQVFIPYKEVLEIMESGLRVPDDVTLMWCDDNYGYMTRLSDEAQQRRKGGGGVYYHLSYWGRPHDYLWLTTTQPGLIYTEMRAAYDHNCRRLWMVNVHDPKVAAYDLELFLDMAWNIDGVNPSTLDRHLERWLSTQFGDEAGRRLAPVMQRFYRLCAIRKPEFMGWTQVELDKRQYPGGKSQVGQVELTLAEACQRLADFGAIEAAVESYARLVPERLHDAYFAAVLYPVHAAAAMSRKLLSEPVESRRAYQEIQSLTDRYNRLNGGKWRGLMSAAPRSLPVFGEVRATLAEGSYFNAGRYVARNACDYQRFTTPSAAPVAIQMLGHSMRAVAIPKGCTLIYEFDTADEGDAVLYTAMIPTQPSDKGDLRYEVALDDQPPLTVSLKTPYRSETWKQSVLRGQALKPTPVRVAKGRHTLRITALDDHIIADQWLLDFVPDRKFYLIPTENE